MQNIHQTPGGLRSFGLSRPTQFIINKLHGTHPNQIFHPLPPPTGPAPYRLALESVLPPDRIQQINAAGRLVFSHHRRHGRDKEWNATADRRYAYGR